MLTQADIEHAIRKDDPHFPRTRLVCLENTHNRMGGRTLKPEYIDSVGELAHKHGLLLHIDGARLMNACTSIGVDPARMVAAADTVSVCLSKGLAAPLGSLILGSHAFIARARRLRKALGGGMRQVGVVAAPALIGLNEMSTRLGVDHDNAKALAVGVDKIDGLRVDVDTTDSNIVIVWVDSDTLTAHDVSARLKEKGILASARDADSLRAVTHYMVSSGDVDRTIEAFQSAVSS